MGYRRHPKINWTLVDGDVVAVDSRNADVHVLQGATAVIWLRLDDIDRDGLVNVAILEFGVDRERAEHDIDTAIELLDATGLLS